jgi:hypothetical protein
MPPVTCEYCSVVLQHNKSLSRHQRSKKCLEKQNELGLNPTPFLFSCKCGFSSAIRGELNAHLSKCRAEELSHSLASNITNNTTNIANTNIQNTQNTQNNFFFFNGLDDLAKTYISRAMNLPDDVKRELLSKGYSALSGKVIVSSITNSDGNADIRVADAARKKLAYKATDGTVKNDPGGEASSKRIGAAVDEVILSVQKDGADSKEMGTILDANTDRKNGRPILRGLIFDNCPKTFGESVFSIDNSSTADKLYKIEEEYHKKCANEKLERAEKWKKYLRSQSMTDPETRRYWNDSTLFVWSEPKNGIVLWGKSIKYQGALIKFSRADLKNIDRMGLSSNVASNARENGAEEFDLPPSVEPTESRVSAWLSKFMRWAVRGKDGLMRDSRMKLAVNIESVSREKFIIMGAYTDWSDELRDITDEQMDQLRNAGVDGYIDPERAPKRYIHDSSSVKADTVCYTSQIPFLPCEESSVPDKRNKQYVNPPVYKVDENSDPDESEDEDDPVDNEVKSDEKELDPQTEFLRNSKLLPDGTWLCTLSKFHKLIYRPVTSSGRPHENITKYQDMKWTRNFDFLGTAPEGPGIMKPLTEENKRIINDLGFNHVPTKIAKTLKPHR